MDKVPSLKNFNIQYSSSTFIIPQWLAALAEMTCGEMAPVGRGIACGGKSPVNESASGFEKLQYSTFLFNIQYSSRARYAQKVQAYGLVNGAAPGGSRFKG